MLKKIDRYEVQEELGHGGMATVYRALDTKLDRAVALKVMHPHLRGAKEARARFRREAQSVARLGHKSILEIYDYSGEDSEESYIATQLLTGPTLRAWADRHAPVPAEIAACVGIEIASALCAAHDKGIVHRDVKPENILLHENAKVVLTDFGIAGMLDAQTMTATGQILGSPGHMAPEQIEGEVTDARTDVFALGTVLFFLSTGRLPFTGKNPHQILKRIVDGEYPDPLRLEPKMGGRMREILTRALRTDPAERHADARALEAELRAFVEQVGIDDPGAELARFLASPAEQTTALSARIVESYKALGRAAQAAGDIPRASDCFARVLAYDEGNQEVLAWVSQIGQRSPKDEPAPTTTTPRWALAALIGLGLVGLAGAWRAFGGDERDGRIDGGTVIAAADRDDVSVDDAGAAVLDGGGGDEALDASVTDALVDAPSDAADARPLEPVARRTAPLLPPRGSRRVELVIDPQNVSVSIDDGAPVSYVTLARGIELSFGVHSMFVRSNTDCCRDQRFDIDVPPGEGSLTVSRRLESTPASLSVRGTPAALTVTVDDGRARGRGYGALINVPIHADARRERLRVEAAAPGHVPFSTELDFAAGELTETTIRLEPEPTAPTPPPEE